MLRFASPFALIALLAASPAAAQRADWNGAIKIGRPYMVGGVQYVPRDDQRYTESGTASWYGDKFHGRPTSSGEAYDMHELTAAHRTLPMPSYVSITNLENGREVVVRVNDRGPFHSNRIVDVSRRAAELLGFKDRGMAKVRLQRVFPTDTPQQRVLASISPGLNVDGPAPDVLPALPAGRINEQPLPPPSIEVLALAQGTDGPRLASYFIQVATLGDEMRAQQLASDIGRFGATFIEPMPGSAGQLFRVRLGPYVNRAVAAAMIADLAEAGFADAVILSPDESAERIG